MEIQRIYRFWGDFIHTFVTEPSATLAGIAEEAVRPGKARMQMHSDGTILMQSVADIAIERVCRVVTPTEKKGKTTQRETRKTSLIDLIKNI